MVIYKTTNIINNKIYIGKDERNNKSYLGSGLILKLAIKKYGVNSFLKKIIDTAKTKEELIEKEKYWIKRYNATDKNIGYNIRLGGEGGDKNKELRKPFTEQHKKNIKINHANVSGKNNPMYGKTHTDAVKEILAIANTGKKFSKKTKKKMSLKRKGELNSNSKLTIKDVLKIRHLHSKGSSQHDLSILFNVKKPCIWKIVNKYIWKDM